MTSPIGPMLFIYDKELDSPYLPLLSNYTQDRKVKAFNGPITTLAEIRLSLEKVGIKQVLTTRIDLVKKLLPESAAKTATINNYAGSIIPMGGGIEVLVLPPMKQLRTVSYVPFLYERYISKFLKPNKWRNVSAFDWTILDNRDKRDELFKELDSGLLCGVDIETSPGMRILSVSYTIQRRDLSTRTFVTSVNDLGDVALIRAVNDTEIPKALQNGKYDSAYFHAYSAPLVNYCYDTVNMLHAWYAELPKDLGSLAAFFIRDVMYWKDLGKSDELIEQLRYNGLDTWATVEVATQWLLEAPKWARKNYIQTMRMVPSCIQMEMTGIKRDEELLEKYNVNGQKELASDLLSIQKMVGKPNFNPSSPKQVLTLMHVLGDKKAESTDDKSVQKSILLHPLNERILGAINTYRSSRKELSTYLPFGVETTGVKVIKQKLLGKEYCGRILYSLNPHGTDTGRLGSRESSLSIIGTDEFNCGLQIQNITADGIVKDTFIADDDFEFYEADFKQAEARGVAYKSGDEALLAAVNSEKDFHAINTAAFFGVKYEDVFDDSSGKTLDKALRDLAKRTNHGANYNMGARVMLDTMGEKKVRQAQKLLDLPKQWSLIQVCQHLLDQYERTYPRVKTTYYNSIKAEVRTSNKLTGDTGWTRWCFGDPSANKMDLNAYVAHVTQSLNAMILNEAVRRVWNKYWNDPDVKLLAQIHDSILFLARKSDIGRMKAKDISELMVFGVEIKDCLGKVREMVVPVDLKCQGYRWSGKQEKELAYAA